MMISFISQTDMKYGHDVCVHLVVYELTKIHNKYTVADSKHNVQCAYLSHIAVQKQQTVIVNFVCKLPYYKYDMNQIVRNFFMNKIPYPR